MNIAATVLFERSIECSALSLNDRDRDFFWCKNLHQTKIHQFDQSMRHELKIAWFNIPMNNRWFLAV